MALLEIACFRADDAIVACNAGADRIELCEDREAGGTTPSLESLLTVRQHVNIPVFVMIRPRGGNFNYSDLEFNQMKADIDTFKPRADGYVFGILDQQHRVDIEKTAELVRRAHPLPCTFHRAFDEVRDHSQALEDVITAGCHAVLSSGGAQSAVTGTSLLSELIQRSRGRITIMPGGGVRAKNVNEIRERTGASMYHSSGILNGMAIPEAGEIRQMKMLLREQTLDRLESFEISQESSRHAGLDEDEDISASQMHLSAVSIGANTPIDELNRCL